MGVCVYGVWWSSSNFANQPSEPTCGLSCPVLSSVNRIDLLSSVETGKLDAQPQLFTTISRFPEASCVLYSCVLGVSRWETVLGVMRSLLSKYKLWIYFTILQYKRINIKH